MARWVPFVGLTALVLTLLLGLARLSQGLVRDGQPLSDGHDGPESGSPDGHRTDSTAGGSLTDGRPSQSAPEFGPESRPETAVGGTAGSSDTAGSERRSGTTDSDDGSNDGTATAHNEGPPHQSRPDDVTAASDNTRVQGADSLTAESSPPSGVENRPQSATRASGAKENRTAEGAPQRHELTTGALLANVAVTQGLFGGIVLAGALFYDIPGKALGVTASPWSTGIPALAVGLGFGLVLWSGNEVSAAVADAVGAAYDEGLREMLSPDSRVGWLVLLGLVLPLIALVEEFLFRAAIIGVPAAGFGVSPWALAIVSSTAFAFGHGAQGRVGIAVTGGLGFVLAGGFILTGSLLVVVVAHYVVNAMEFLVHEWLAFDRPSL